MGMMPVSFVMFPSLLSPLPTQFQGACVALDLLHSSSPCLHGFISLCLGITIQGLYGQHNQWQWKKAQHCEDVVCKELHEVVRMWCMLMPPVPLKVLMWGHLNNSINICQAAGSLSRLHNGVLRPMLSLASNRLIYCWHSWWEFSHASMMSTCVRRLS